MIIEERGEDGEGEEDEEGSRRWGGREEEENQWIRSQNSKEGKLLEDKQNMMSKQENYFFLVAHTRLYTLAFRSVRPSNHLSVEIFTSCEHHCSCPTVRDWIAVYPALFSLHCTFWAAAPKEIKSCRTQGNVSVHLCLSISLSICPFLLPHTQGFVSFKACTKF